MVQKLVAIVLGKSILKVSQLFKIGGGAAAPGYYALKVEPNLVSQLAKDVPQTIVITGTNGKTTTARFVAHFAKLQGLKVIHNSTGSNLERGIASALISHTSLYTGKLKKVDLAIWELDEAAFNQVVPKIKPTVIVFLNAFRDQLDRYGEVDSVIKRWSQTLSKLDSSVQLIINGDDHNLLQLTKSFPGKVQTFGVKDQKIAGEKIVHQTKAGKLLYEAADLKTQGLSQTTFSINYNKQHFSVNLPLPGLYNIYNFLAAFACAQTLGWSMQALDKALAEFTPAFGRVEKLSIKTPQGEKEGYIFLIKNPTGATQVFQTLRGEIKEKDRLLLALNDNLADGTDVSWIWDVNFELIQNSSRAQSHIRQAQCDPERQSNGSRDFHVICSGTRAEDLALRLKYTGFEPSSLTIIKPLEKALEEATRGLNGRLFILPTYTALLDIQHYLTSAGIKKHYWKEEG